MAKVFVALSGGVDSGVAAVLLKREGHDVSGIFMRHGFMPTLSRDESEEAAVRFGRNSSLLVCTPKSDGQWDYQPYRSDLFLLPIDAASAWEIAAFLNIPLVIFNADTLFAEVTNDFIRKYYEGKTPNPCVFCNRILKFGRMVRLVEELGGRFMATGHYVHLKTHEKWLQTAMSEDLEIPDWLGCQAPDQLFLAKGSLTKDQSYVLYSLRRESLPKLLFPLNELVKERTREIAAETGLPVAQRKDSQETCFAEDGNHLAFLRDYGPKIDTCGSFVSLDGKVLAPHRGYEHYTVGQRKGLGIGFGERIFVQKIESDTHNVVLGPYESLGRTVIHAIHCNWHLDLPENFEFECDVKIRYRNRAVRGRVTLGPNRTMVAEFDEPRFAVAPGQSLVCYWEDRLLGGGEISDSY